MTTTINFKSKTYYGKEHVQIFLIIDKSFPISVKCTSCSPELLRSLIEKDCWATNEVKSITRVHSTFTLPNQTQPIPYLKYRVVLSNDYSISFKPADPTSKDFLNSLSIPEEVEQS